ncbi:MAG: hypothetical protein ACREKN_08240 [Longimicrobiaceae bacterium]
MNEERAGPEKRAGARLGEGIRAGIGVLTAVKEAIEETIQEAVDRGDLNPERAKSAVRDATRRARDGLGEVRERLDLVQRREFDLLRAEVAEMRARLDRLETGPGDVSSGE